jgi:hypothetical protein
VVVLVTMIRVMEKDLADDLKTRSDSYTYNIPRCIPDGEYLLRIQQLGLHNPGAAPQFYISCAQIKVTGGGTTNPTPTALIPGAFRATDPGYTVNVSQPLSNFHINLMSVVQWVGRLTDTAGNQIYNTNLANYVVPGPRVVSHSREVLCNNTYLRMR